MVRRRIRDIYGNWVWEDDEDQKEREDSEKPPSEQSRSERESGSIQLDWRDYVALTIASLETFLLPIVVFIVVILLILVGIAIARH